MWQYNNTNELYHYGVLGMKWGVRKNKSNLGDVSTPKKKVSDKELREYRQEMIARYDKNAPKKQFYKNATEDQIQNDIHRRQTTKKIIIAGAVTAAVGVGIFAAYKYNVAYNLKGSSDKGLIKKVMKDSFDDVDMVLEKGSSIHRMTAYKDIDFSKISDPTYVAYKEKDVAKYMSMLKDWSGTGERYDVLFEATKDIRIPSEKNARKIFEELWDSDPTYKTSLMDSLTKTFDEFYFPEAAKKQASVAIATDPFKAGIYSIVRKNEDSKKLLNKMAEAGYDAVEDYFDKGTFTDSPIILFNPSSSVVKKGETFVTELMQQEALARAMS